MHRSARDVRGMSAREIDQARDGESLRTLTNDYVFLSNRLDEVERNNRFWRWVFLILSALMGSAVVALTVLVLSAGA